MHARQTIRETVAATLTGLATTGARVYQSRGWPVRDAAPALSVYTRSEARVEGEDGLSSTVTLRVLRLVVELSIPVGLDSDDTLDQASAEIEAALYGAVHGPSPGALAALVEGIAYAGIEVEDPDPDLGFIAAEIEFELLYSVDGLDPETIL